MTEIIGIRFKKGGKVYYFSPNNQKFSLNDKAIVETARGVECGDVVIENRFVEDSAIVPPLKDVIRKPPTQICKLLRKTSKRKKKLSVYAEDKIAFVSSICI